MKKLTLALLAGLVLTACPDKEGDSGETGTTMDGGSMDGGADDTVYVACSWDSSGFTLDITNGDAAGYNLGFAEVDSTSSDPWTGEDCGYVGYTTGDGTYYDFCHDMSATGGSLTTVSTFGDIVEGSTTIHSGAIENAYYLYEVGTGTCWTWGVTADYFYDCTDATASLSCSGD